MDLAQKISAVGRQPQNVSFYPENWIEPELYLPAGFSFLIEDERKHQNARICH